MARKKKVGGLEGILITIGELAAAGYAVYQQTAKLRKRLKQHKTNKSKTTIKKAIKHE